MAELKSGTVLGYVDFGDGKSFETLAVAFEGSTKIHTAQKVSQNIDGVVYVGYKIRSRNFVDGAHYFKLNDQITAEQIALLEPSKAGDNGGFQAPEGFVLPVGWSTKNDGTPDTFIYKTNDIDLDGVEESTTATGLVASTRNAFTQVWDYAIKNPAMTIGAGLLLGYVIHLFLQSQKPARKRKKYLGMI